MESVYTYLMKRIGLSESSIFHAQRIESDVHSTNETRKLSTIECLIMYKNILLEDGLLGTQVRSQEKLPPIFMNLHYASNGDEYNGELLDEAGISDDILEIVLKNLRFCMNHQGKPTNSDGYKIKPWLGCSTVDETAALLCSLTNEFLAQTPQTQRVA